jgi:hypothetical protein
VRTHGARALIAALALASASGCDKGSSGKASPPVLNYVRLQSDAADYVGQGLDYEYTQADARIDVTAIGARLVVTIAGDESWTGVFQEPEGLETLTPGTWEGVTRFPFHDPTVGGLDWSGEGRGCNTLTGSFAVERATYTNGTLTAIDLRFEQRCEGGTPVLSGEIHWDASDTTAPPGPVLPAPDGLWAPVPGSTPASGSWVFLESDSGDYVGAGRSYIYTTEDAGLTVAETGGHLTVQVSGFETWFGDFQTMDTATRLELGYYGKLQRYPFHNSVRGGLSWYGEGRGCNALSGWFVVDSVTYAAGALTAVDLRFEQHCEGGTPALHGAIHWDVADAAPPSGPQDPPTGLWQPAAVPSTGNFVYLESEAGDPLGAGKTFVYTQADAILTTVSSGAHLAVSVNGDESWSGNFQAMSSIPQLQPGYYGHLTRYPFQNPAFGGLDWSGMGLGCNMLTGWFVIDSVTYTSDALTAIDLRFEQHCDGATAALHGRVRWDASDTTAPPGPVAPPPADLWAPPPAVTPSSGNYVYLESDAGDWIGAGGTHLYTPANAALSVTSGGASLAVIVSDDQYLQGSFPRWQGRFQGMSGLPQIAPGYYGGLQLAPGNPARGGLEWSGEGRACNTLTGWFVVDSVTYTSGVLMAVDLRFEQHCDGGTPALHGQVHWAR